MLERMNLIWQDAKQLKDERGLTLVELLVVVVILGIIAAIAVVAIGGIIENSKKDAMVADAKQMVSSAKIYAASNNVTSEKVLNFNETEGKAYISSLKDPFNSNDTEEYSAATVTIANDGTKYSYTVNLSGDKFVLAGGESDLKKSELDTPKTDETK